MTGEVADSLAAMLKAQPQLQALNLNDTSLEDSGVAVIAQALTKAGKVNSAFATVTISRLQCVMYGVFSS